MEPASLKVVTLNCWGIPFGVSKDVKERFTAIAHQLNTNDYDIVGLQEIWSQDQFRFLVDRCRKSLPYSHYFHSGMIGAGVCILSKFPIKNAFVHRFALNGLPYMLTHGDWLAGKAVGVCRVQLANGKEVFVLNTHTHAEYKLKIRKDYNVHRTLQYCDLATLISHLSNFDTRRVFGLILMGDLNGRPKELGYKILTTVGGLEDSWITVHDQENDAICTTSDRPDNMYSKRHVNYSHSQGQRIDYIFTAGFLRAKECRIRPWGSVIKEGSSIPFSDHEPVQAVIEMTEGLPERKAVPEDSAALSDEIIEIFQEGVLALNKLQLICVIALGVVCFALYFLIAFLSPPYLLNAILFVSAIVAIVFVVWQLMFRVPLEINVLTGAIANVSSWLPEKNLAPLSPKQSKKSNNASSS